MTPTRLDGWSVSTTWNRKYKSELFYTIIAFLPTWNLVNYQGKGLEFRFNNYFPHILLKCCFGVNLYLSFYQFEFYEIFAIGDFVLTNRVVLFNRGFILSICFIKEAHFTTVKLQFNKFFYYRDVSRLLSFSTTWYGQCFTVLEVTRSSSCHRWVDWKTVTSKITRLWTPLKTTGTKKFERTKYWHCYH